MQQQPESDIHDTSAHCPCVSIIYHNLNFLGPPYLNAEYSGINCLNIALEGWNL